MKIITALWGDKYSEKDVYKLPIDLCFSDRSLNAVKTLPIDMSWPRTWKKMTLFNPKLNLGECLFLDLDIILQGDINIMIDYYQRNKTPGKPMCAHVHWFDNEKMKLDKATYLPCNINTSVFAFNNSECEHIYNELIQYGEILPMLFEGTDKWWYHRHSHWCDFFPDEMVQHSYWQLKSYERDKAIIISENSKEKWKTLN